MTDDPIVSIVIVSYRVRNLLRACLSSIPDGLDGLAAEVCVVDNASDDGAADTVSDEFPWVRLIRNSTNRGFAAANNQALREVRGTYVLLLNPDTEVRHRAIAKQIDFLDRHPEAGVVGPQLVGPDGRPQISVRAFPSLSGTLFDLAGMKRIVPEWLRFESKGSVNGNANQARAVDSVCGACMAIRRSAIEQVGLLDERFFMYAEDVDWCKRFWSAGWSVWFNPEAEVVHFGGQSSAKAVAPGEIELWYAHVCQNDVVYFRKHSGIVVAWLVKGVHVLFALWGRVKWRALAWLFRDATFKRLAEWYGHKLSYAWQARV